MNGQSKALDPRLRRLVQHVADKQMRELQRELERGVVASAAEEALPGEPLDESSLYKRVLVKFSGEAIPDSLIDLPWTQIAGDIYTVRVPLMQLAALAETPGVQFVSGGHAVAAALDTSRTEARVTPLHGSVPPLTGAGVVVGIIDFGCDFRLQDFRDPQTGATRIAFLWDQGLVPIAGEHSPAGFPHGVEYTAADVDATIGGAGTVRHVSPAEAHGTHVTGIAAGNGQSADAAFPVGQFIGMAPAATIIFVQPFTDPADNSFTDSVHVAEAMAYIFRKAQQLGLPCVINMSLGQNGGSHDGESVVERAVDRLLEEPGRAFVAAAGNEHVFRTHAEGQLATGQTRALAWRVGGPAPFPGAQPGPDRTSNEMEIWYSSRDAFEVRVVDPAGNATQAMQPADPALNVALPGGNEVFIDSERFTVMNGDARIYIQVSPGSSATVASGVWNVEITAVDAQDGAFDAWIERDARDAQNQFADQSFFDGVDFTPTKTLGTPATTRRVIAVANYRHRPPPVVISDSSGRGPTRDGRRKPEVAAPGTAIRSANSQGGQPFAGGVRPVRVPKSGTSMAAPHVAGIVALMLQRNPRLTSAQIAKILIATVRPSPAGVTGFDESFGFGLVDAQAAVAAVP